MNTESIVSRVWSFCNPLRDVGVGYGDYLEQLTFLIFLKMADEYAKPPHNRNVGIPPKYDWTSLRAQRGAALEEHYSKTLKELGKLRGMLGAIFTKADNKIHEPAMLYRVIEMIDKEQWTRMGADVKGEIYEGLLQKNAEDTKSGAGQYFTPRALIRTMVECVQPEPGRTIADPACGTGGFLLAAYDYLNNPENYQLDRRQKEFLKHDTFSGNEIVASTRRLCLMNLVLHSIGDIDDEPSVASTDALISAPGETVDYVFANPPFGKKSSITATNDEDEQETQELSYNRQDFWTTSSNKQLNFVQHIVSMLKVGGQAAVVVPDNVLFEGGAGEVVRKQLLKNTNLHTILRLPTGIFYAHGVKANVLFFDNKASRKEAWTKEIWFYDYRTNVHHTLKKKPLREADLADFVECYLATDRAGHASCWDEAQNPDGRWRCYSTKMLASRDKTSLDVFWLRDASLTNLDDLPASDVLAQQIIENLEAALVQFRQLAAGLEKR